MALVEVWWHPFSSMAHWWWICSSKCLCKMWEAHSPAFTLSIWFYFYFYFLWDVLNQTKNCSSLIKWLSWLFQVPVALTSCMDIQRLPCFWYLTMRHKEFCPLFSLNMLVSLFLIFQILFLTSSILAWDLMQTSSWFNSLRREFATLACRETVKII